jgi:hypothetical protein
MRFHKAPLAVSVVLMLAVPLVDGQEAHKSNTWCTRDKAIAGFVQAVRSQGGTVDSVHLKGGMAVVASASTSDAVKAIQDRAATYIAEQKDFKDSSLDEHCRAMLRAIKESKIDYELVNTASGVLFVFLARDSSSLPIILGDCCDWCVCPAGTHTGCARCC